MARAASAVGVVGDAPPAASVLVVDDDEAAREALCKMLRAGAFEVEECGSAAEALSRLACARHPTIVVLDLVMPELDGYALLRMVRGHPSLSDLPIVVISGLDEDTDAARAFELGADDFLRKPVRPLELIARIRGQIRLQQYVRTLARRERDAQAVAAITQALSSSLDSRDVLFTVVQRVAELLEVDRCTIVLLRDEGNLGYVVATSDDEHLRDVAIELNGYPEIREAMESGKSVVMHEAETPPLLGSATAGDLRWVALAPISFEGRAMGVLLLHARHPLAFNEHEIALLRTIANATGIALRNARVVKSLLDETRENTAARFEAEKRMRALERYADFFECTADGSIVIDAEGTILLCNARVRAITGYSDAELLGRQLVELLRESERPKAQTLLRDFQRGVYPQGIDIRLQTRDGGRLIVSVNTSSVLREESAILLSFRDVTEERATAIELKQTKELLERIIDNSVDAIVASDVTGNVILHNRAARRCLGYQPAEAVGNLHIAQVFPPEVVDEIQRLISMPEHIRAHRLQGHRCDLLDRSRQVVPISLSAALLYDEGKPMTCVSLFTDLRERVRMEQQLESAQQELRLRERQAAIAEVAGAAAHELNQPLTSVMGYAELLRRRLERDESAQSLAAVILSEAERIAGIVRKIGKATRYETKAYVGAAKILDLDKASEQAEHRDAQPGSDRTKIPAAWLDRLVATQTALSVDAGPRDVVRVVLDAVADTLLDHAIAVGVSVASGADGPEDRRVRRWLFRRPGVATAEQVTTSGRVFPELSCENRLDHDGPSVSASISIAGKTADAVADQGPIVAFARRALGLLVAGLNTARLVERGGGNRPGSST